MNNFDSKAKDFDTKLRIDRSVAIAEEICKHISKKGGKSAIDFGCGTGLVGFELINKFDSIIFLDSSVEMIKQVENKLKNANTKNASAICCDLMDKIPENLSADYIFSSLVLHHITDTKTILTHLYNILKPNGHLLIIDLDTDNGGFHAGHADYDGHNGFSHEFLINLTKEIGFKKTEIKTFYNDIKIIGELKHPYSLFIMDAIK